MRCSYFAMWLLLCRNHTTSLIKSTWCKQLKKYMNIELSDFANELFSCCCFFHSGEKAQQSVTAACVCLIKMHYRFTTAGETSRVIVVKSSINIIYHLRSDPTAWAPIHHEHTNKYTAIRLMMKYLLPSCPTRAEISVKISVMKNAWTEWTPAHLSVDWSRSWLLSLLLSARLKHEVMNQSDSSTLGLVYSMRAKNKSKTRRTEEQSKDIVFQCDVQMEDTGR